MQGPRYVGARAHGLCSLGAMPCVMVEQGGRGEELHARLVVGADGRGSLVRTWTGFPVQQDAERLLISGVLYDEMWTPQEDTGYYVMNPSLGQAVPLFPQGQVACARTWSTRRPRVGASREP